jgi:hypothetical protein
MQNVDHNIGLCEKRHFLPKMGKNRINCDHNIDPGSEDRTLNILRDTISISR